MINIFVSENNAFDERIKKLIILRAFFAVLIIGITLYFHSKEGFTLSLDLSLKIIYFFSLFIQALTILYIYLF